MRLRTLAVLAALLLPAAAPAQDQRYVQRRATLAHGWNFVAAAANDAKNVALADLADSTNYAIAGQTDTCRQIAATITDANSSVTAGVLTVAYVDCLNYPVTWTLNFATPANQGSGVRIIGYARSVTSVSTNALTGEAAGVDKIKVGDSTAPPITWGAYGVLRAPGPSGEHAIDVFGTYPVAKRITTSGTLSTTVTAVGSNGAFADVSVNDILVISQDGQTDDYRVTAKASNNSVTVHKAVSIPATLGVPFAYRKWFTSSNPADVLAVPVTGAKGVTFVWDVSATVNVGNLISRFECTQKSASWPTGIWAERPQSTPTVASGATTVGSDGLPSGVSLAVDLSWETWDYCRVGMRYGTSGASSAITITAEVLTPPVQ